MQGYPFPGGGHPGAPETRRLCDLLAGRAQAHAGSLAALAAVAETHGVAPLLRERVLAGACGDAAPALRDAALRDAALEARRNGRLREAIAALAGAGVPSLLFKGTALAHTHYPRPELRPRDDTDLLVRPRHAAAAGTVLARLGLAAVPAVEGSRIMRQRLYRARDGDGVLHNLDLHWAVSNSARARSFEPHPLLARSRELPVLAPGARVPCDEDALLLACLHLDAHHASAVRLIWLWDVHLLLGGMSAKARRRAAEAACARGIAGACAWVIADTRAAFDTSVEGLEPVLAAARARRPSPLRAAAWLRELRHLESNRARAAWLAQHLFPPPESLRRPGERAPVWWLYLRRLLRGPRHLLGR